MTSTPSTTTRGAKSCGAGRCCQMITDDGARVAMGRAAHRLRLRARSPGRIDRGRAARWPAGSRLSPTRWPPWPVLMATRWQGPRPGGLLAIVTSLAFLSAACSTAPTTHSQATAASTAAASTTQPTSTTASSPPPTSVASTTTAPTFPSGIQVGPGPQAHYTVQPQPAPGSCQYSYSGSYPLPDPRCTPGAVNPAVTQANISSTICSAGYTAGIRPPENITEPEKIASAAAYSYSGSLQTAEYDHLIALELGGDPNDAANLWVEPNDRAGATTTLNTKDTLENRLNKLVCSGQMTLAAARQAIATDWVGAYEKYG